MGRISRVLRCNHCGALLQMDDSTKQGYIPPDVINSNERILYCQDCYDKLQINFGTLKLGVDEDTLTILKDARATDSLIVYFIDLFSFNGFFDMNLVEQIKKLDLVVVANKRDLFSNKVDEKNIINYIRDSFSNVGLNPLDVIITSSYKNYNISSLEEKILKYRNAHDIYVIGPTQSGKSVAIDKMLKEITNTTSRAIKSKLYPHTNKRVLIIPIDNSTSIYDIPGFYEKDSLTSHIEKTLNKYLSPKKELQPKKIKLGKDETLLVGGLISLSLMNDIETEIQCYFAEGVEFKKMKQDKVARFAKENNLKHELRPVSDLYQDFSDFDLFRYDMEDDDEYHEIAIKGCGFFVFKAKGQIFHISIPRRISVKEAKSRVKYVK